MQYEKGQSVLSQNRARPANFQEWAETLPPATKDDPLWSAHFYQKARFLYDLCWFDCEPWLRDTRERAIAEQIIRSCGSISANIEEGYGRGFGRDYARFLVIATGSTRETRGWYLRVRHLISEATLEHRLQLCNEIIRMLIPVIQDQRQRK